MALREAVADHLAVSRGLAVDAEDVIITGGTSDALHLVVAMLRNRSPQPRILVEDPGYPHSTPGHDGGRRTAGDSAGGSKRPKQLTAGLAGGNTGCSPGDPRATNTPWAAGWPSRKGWGGCSNGQTSTVFWCWRMTMTANSATAECPLPAMASLPSAADVVLLGTFSKNLSPWLRCGYLVVRGNAGEMLKAMREALDTPVAGVLQSAIAHYIKGGGLSRHITRARREYAHRRSLLMDRLNPRDDLELTALDGGLHAVIRFKSPDATSVATKALELGVRVVPLAGYYADRPAENGLVVGYGGAVSDLQLAKALAVLSGLIGGGAQGLRSDPLR